MPRPLKPRSSIPSHQPRAEVANSQPLRRRELFGVAASSFAALVNAWRPAAARTEVVRTPEGKVLRWHGDDLLVLVSGLQDSYRLGQEVRLKVMLNNQTPNLGQYRLRAQLVDGGQQVVAEAPVVSMQVQPFDASEIERVLSPAPALEAGDYLLVIELPPWRLEGRTAGGGALSVPLQLAA